MKKIVFSLAVLVMITGLAGCGSQEKGESTSASTAAAAPAEIEVTDSNGKVTVPFSPKKSLFSITVHLIQWML